MQPDTFDTRAPRRRISLNVNGDLYARTKAAGIDVSEVAEVALAEALRRKQTEALHEQIRQDREALAQYIAAHGDPRSEWAAMFDANDAA